VGPDPHFSLTAYRACFSSAFPLSGRYVSLKFLAEGVGFEPTEPCGSLVLAES